MSDQQLPSSEYEYGFHDEDVSVYNTGKGLTEQTIRDISAMKHEPEWMLDLRLKAYRKFRELPNPTWGPDLNDIDFDEFTYYIKPSDRQSSDWEDVPETIRDTFDKLGIPRRSRSFSPGSPPSMNPRWYTTTCWRKWRKRASFSWTPIPPSGSTRIW